MSEITAGWYLTASSVWAHHVTVKPGHLRVVYRADCGRRGSTWTPVDQTVRRCHQCEEIN